MKVKEMKPAPQRYETRSELVFRHTSRMLHETRCSWEAFGQRLVEHYHAAVPAEARDVQFQTTGDVFHCAKINAQKICRYADDRVNARLPVDLEESWVEALAEPYRTDCIRDLARRYGLLAVQVPVSLGCTVSAMQSVSAVSREFGQAIEAVAPIIENGKFGPEDLPHVDRALRELEDLIGAAEATRAQLLAIQNPNKASA